MARSTSTVVAMRVPVEKVDGGRVRRLRLHGRGAAASGDGASVFPVACGDATAPGPGWLGASRWIPVVYPAKSVQTATAVCRSRWYGMGHAPSTLYIAVLSVAAPGAAATGSSRPAG